MSKRKIKLEWRTQFFGLAFLALVACGPAQKETKQAEKAPTAQQPEKDPTAVKLDPSSMQESVPEPTAVVLNPPHGEPGHICEIPVRSPLPTNASSAVESTNPKTSPAAAEATKSYNSMSPTVENARRLKATQGNQAQSPPTGKKPKLNPPHGQPWHRCDVNVGSPLP